MVSAILELSLIEVLKFAAIREPKQNQSIASITMP